jgi:hypothetical protein
VDEITSQIKPIDAIARGAEHNLLAVFLLTPTFSKWLVDNNGFMQQALQQAVSKISARIDGGIKVQALAAVVDRLPIPKGVQAALEDEDTHRVERGSVQNNGLEGLSYAFLSGSRLLAVPRQTKGSKAADLSSKPSHMLGINIRTSHSDSKSKLLSDRSYDLQIPLANTIFQTGFDATISTSIWTIRHNHAGLSMGKIAFHDHAAFDWPFQSPGVPSLKVPLIPLTLPRKIHSGMGNIIRQTVDADGSIVPASQELERAVMHYFGVLNMPQWAIPVWALILPADSADTMARKLKKSEVLGGQEPSISNMWTSARRENSVGILLAQGCKLHRVQGGGGGWGKKAGLLSLNPASFEDSTAWTYSNHGNTPVPPDEDFTTQLERVAKEGDFIQFYVTPADVEETEQPELSQTESRARKVHLEFGTIPTSADDVPSNAPQSGSVADKIILRENFFGALSETSMNLRGLISDTEAIKADDISSAGDFEFLRTKIDVPYSKFSICECSTTENPPLRHDERNSFSQLPTKAAATRGQIPHRKDRKPRRERYTAKDQEMLPIIRKVFSKVKHEKEHGIFVRRVYKVVQRDEYREDSDKAWKRMQAMQWKASSEGERANLPVSPSRASTRQAPHDLNAENTIGKSESILNNEKNLEGATVKRVSRTKQKLAEGVEALLKGF